MTEDSEQFTVIEYIWMSNTRHTVFTEVNMEAAYVRMCVSVLLHLLELEQDLNRNKILLETLL